MRMLLITLFLILSTTGRAEVSVDPDNALVIRGIIAQGNILSIGNKLIDMAREGKSSADLVINSPGGEVATGFLFINQMEDAKNRGLTIRCFIPGMAASMAFQILLHCSERYTLDKAFLLWHRARVTMGGLFGQPSTGPELLRMGHELVLLDATILREVISVLGRDLDESVIKWHFEAETLHVGSALSRMAPHFIQSLPAISGLVDALFNSKLPHEGDEDMKRLMHPGQIIYISPRVVK